MCTESASTKQHSPNHTKHFSCSGSLGRHWQTNYSVLLFSKTHWSLYVHRGWHWRWSSAEADELELALSKLRVALGWGSCWLLPKPGAPSWKTSRVLVLVTALVTPTSWLRHVSREAHHSQVKSSSWKHHVSQRQHMSVCSLPQAITLSLVVWAKRSFSLIFCAQCFYKQPVHTVPVHCCVEVHESAQCETLLIWLILSFSGWCLWILGISYVSWLADPLLSLLPCEKGQARMESANKTSAAPVAVHTPLHILQQNCRPLPISPPHSAAIYESASRYHSPSGEAMPPWKERRSKRLIREWWREKDGEKRTKRWKNKQIMEVRFGCSEIKIESELPCNFVCKVNSWYYQHPCME